MSIEELATLVGEQITAEKAKAWDEGYRHAEHGQDGLNPYEMVTA